ncbi:hypothetical protein [Streptomyces sp. CRN 30]|uniref:hypothetical protein n=1 Tax=Streptomyces sp. CRN 30 TaxID=3075613 RepID=UPI002A7FC3F8|nr:hypothetical protein [Streptomyces sp. CRN 30]
MTGAEDRTARFDRHWLDGLVQAARAGKAYRQAIEAIENQYYDAHQHAPGPLQLWALPEGCITGPVSGIDHGAPDPAETTVIAWPYGHGKTAAALTASIDVPLTGSMRALFDTLLAGHRAHLDRRLRRLADDLGQWEPCVRRDFAAVQQVLEVHGITDGYGRLTVPQPVRPPVQPPPRRP